MSTDTEKDRVVVGVDGSSGSVAALRYGARMADAFDVPLEAVITWAQPRYIYLDRDRDSESDHGARALLRTAIEKAFGDAPPKDLTQTVLEGPVAKTLVELSDSCGMLVLGSRGRGGFPGMLLGSATRTCVEHAHCPVVVVHPVIADADDQGE